MWKTLTISIILGLAGASLEAQTTVRCESDGGYRECSIDGTGRLMITRLLSDAECIEGRSWGFRNGRVWVDRGCRAEFTMGAMGRAMAQNDWDTVVCESSGRRRTRCVAQTRYGVELARQLSDSRCVQGRTWGFDNAGIWVRGGCRAEFRVMRQPAVHSSAGGFGGARTIVCESDAGGRRHCAADTGGGITLTRQLSDSACVEGRSWGVTSTGVWVDEGCRAEFTIGTGGGLAERRITCESVDGRRTRCPADTSGAVQLVNRISSSGCDFNRDWGYDRNGIWVDNGCRAEFVVRTRAMDRPVFGAIEGTVICESIDGRRKLCPADTRNGVSLYRQLSNSDCTRRRSWGFNRQGIWVDNGCRGEFLLHRR